MLGRAVTETLSAPPAERSRIFARFVQEIEQFMAAHPAERPWTCTIYAGTDGATIFRGGVGHSLVMIQPAGSGARAVTRTSTPLTDSPTTPSRSTR